MPYSFEIYKDKKEEFRVRFKAPNGEKMFSSEGYSSKAAANNAIKSILKNGPAATIVDNTKAVKAAKKAKVAKKKKKKA
ncbi:YegP family protein [Pseudorhodoplanes sp.]|uniref:YegP family protein n=1 Tax=Pseudorhodoplanes sp. TaxID=1934341 RepID=UPI002D08FD83|nr:DUF1508 domain-containing protein [Pseudorhodoplanes sp.]HWV52087.1 DUF1508 domain-containing protein [Pseudorhodoplanes sp.]